MRSDQLANPVNIIATQLASLKGKIPAHGHQHTDFIGLSPDLIFKEQKIDTLGFFKKSFATKWDYTHTRFIAQNFLIEERLDPLRVRSYVDGVPSAGPNSFVEWNEIHNRYLGRYIFKTPPALHDYRVVARDNLAVCPETFRAPLALYTFQGTDLDVALIRLVSVADLAWMANQSEDYVFTLGEQAIADPRTGNPALLALSVVLETAFTGSKCQHRPVFASFYEDFLAEFRDPANTDWPNRLRDRLGLFHINQWLPGGLPRRIFLFKYAVRDIPRHPGPEEAERRPITVPVVCDHRLFEAFCPAPRELDRGRLLNLDLGAYEEPAREVMHLFMPLQVKHLFRVGLVTTPVSDDLAQLREHHLIWLRLLSNRDDFGII